MANGWMDAACETNHGGAVAISSYSCKGVASMAVSCSECAPGVPLRPRMADWQMHFSRPNAHYNPSNTRPFARAYCYAGVSNVMDMRKLFMVEDNNVWSFKLQLSAAEESALRQTMAVRAGRHVQACTSSGAWPGCMPF